MPFTEQNPHAFTREGIIALDPDQNGVYGIYNNQEWIYVGKGEDIRDRLLDHFNGDNPCILNHNPTHFVGEVFKGDPSARERELILELTPTCNKRVG